MGSKLLLSCLWYMKCVKKQNHQLWCHFGPFLLVLYTYKKAEAAAAEAKERERGSAKTALPGKSTKRIMAMD